MPSGGLAREESTSKLIEAVGKSHLLVFMELMAVCFFKVSRGQITPLAVLCIHHNIIIDYILPLLPYHVPSPWEAPPIVFAI